MTPSSSSEEPLIVVPVEQLRLANLGQGFDPSPDAILTAALRPGVARVMSRSLAETDSRYKQIIAYVVLRHVDRVFHYRRSSAVGEPRLAGLRSVGVGGHLNADDVAGVVDVGSLRRAIRRELTEEVDLAEQPSVRFIGVINDDSTDVGKVHVGLVALADLRSTTVNLRDPTLRDGRFDSVSQLIELADSFETWSRLCFPALLSLPVSS